MSLYEEMRRLEDMAVVYATDDFECPICCELFSAGQGIRLKNCLHHICTPCIANLIETSDTAEILCPQIEPNRCMAPLQEREIKALVRKDVYDRYVARSLALAENEVADSFHCRAVNCRGWWVYEGSLNLYKCPVCSTMNCTDCKAIHDGMECQVYKDMQRIGNLDETLSEELIAKLIERKDALRCPKCGVLIMKTAGCEGVVCLCCKLEICWATLGPRWGPGGKGDTSGGCRCMVGGIKCHPKCSNCH